MVHGIETLVANNKKAQRKEDAGKVKVPDKIALHPSLARAYVNRPWTAEELGGRTNAQESYARDAAAPFKEKVLTDRNTVDRTSNG